AATVWVHDFHLMLLPAMLRARSADLTIGFFLHTPFPSSEIYRLLPKREDVLTGVLGADHVAFHTNDYVLHFRRSCLRILGLRSEPDAIEHDGRRVGLGVHPIGVDVPRFTALLAEPQTDAQLAELRDRYRGTKLVLGVERLDYSKGVPLKLDAFERFLAQDPSRVDHVAMLQVLVPSRLGHGDYMQLKSRIEQRIAEINGKFGRPGVVPVQYMHRALTPHELTALYRFADVAMVTPMRDGMNLVAQEYVLCQRDLHGALLLSEFAGAAHVLSGAILVNPWDIERTANALGEALALPADEKRARMAAMQRRVEEMPCQLWAERCLAALRDAANRRRAERGEPVDDAVLAELTRLGRSAPARCVFVDYDGTIREIAQRPESARPTEELRALLAALAALPRCQVHLVSGRDRRTLETWLGDLPLYLCAEHGHTWRTPDGQWTQRELVDLSWLERVREVLLRVIEDVPHTFLEEKATSIAWHYRMADLEYGTWRARELQANLEQMLANEPAEILHGRAVIEVRAAGVNKGTYARQMLAELPPDTLVVVLGDDQTDDDLFRAVPPEAFTVQVGNRRAQNARFTLPTPVAVRAFLHRLCEAWR
ncbi:MAG TPA: bifunctional alpha,alpha-trehalose-phosphate synthase (UDP-forming)/trehalose-phosphatase, partial [Planctomycetota bacterium]|nr:bifunctional alpha,alpha-trehalose-phosphate synthase (UDP-forming)/trehalose-phosphatase [Planctomycetota bacterium]